MAVIFKTIVNQKSNLVKNQIKRSQGYEEHLQYQHIGDVSSEDSNFEVQPVFHREFWLARATELHPFFKKKKIENKKIKNKTNYNTQTKIRFKKVYSVRNCASRTC